MSSSLSIHPQGEVNIEVQCRYHAWNCGEDAPHKRGYLSLTFHGESGREYNEISVHTDAIENFLLTLQEAVGTAHTKLLADRKRVKRTIMLAKYDSGRICP
jgi:hypothetical protein